MSFLRHVGKIGDRKVAVVFREVPNEPHMCLVTYTETLNMHVHEALISTIEGQIGQSSDNLADALNRSYTKDGKIILQVLHAEGLLKKVQTSQVIMTPNPGTKIKLDELNKILTEMEQGEAAVKRLAEIDQSRGMQDPADVARRMKEKVAPIVAPSDGVLGDSIIANNLRQQANKMAAEAQGLLAESNRLLQEAASLDPVKAVPEKAPAKKKGRPAKAVVTA
jgi:hypothetical protein